MENFENKNELFDRSAEETPVAETTEPDQHEPVQKMRPVTRALLISLVILAFAAFLILLSFSMANTGVDTYSELKSMMLG